MQGARTEDTKPSAAGRVPGATGAPKTKRSVALEDPPPVAPSRTLILGSYLNGRNRAVSVYSHLLTISQPPPQTRPSTAKPPKRGIITEFSRSSRKRLWYLLSSIDYRRFARPVWTTLTYHHGWSSDPSAIQRHVNTFLTDLRRQYPTITYIRRVEYQRRGAPHHHLLMMLPAGDDRLSSPAAHAWIAETWHRIADPSSIDHRAHGTHTVNVESWRHLATYISKYLGKVADGEKNVRLNRCWAASRDIPTSSWLIAHFDPRTTATLKRFFRRWWHAGHRRSKAPRWLSSGVGTIRLIFPAAEMLRYLTAVGLLPDSAEVDCDAPVWLAPGGAGP